MVRVVDYVERLGKKAVPVGDEDDRVVDASKRLGETLGGGNEAAQRGRALRISQVAMITPRSRCGASL